MSGGAFVSPETCMQVSAFYSGVIYISTQVAKLPWHVKDKKNIVQETKVGALINNRPNPEMNAFFFRLFMIQSAIVYGNGYAEIERDSLGRPVALWPIHSEHVFPMRLTNGRLVYKIIGGANDGSGADAYILPEDIFHLPNFFTKDGIVGQGVVAYATDVLGISLGADKFANSLFANGAMPSGVIETDSTLSEDAQKRVLESWKQNHGGRKVGGTAILEEGLKYKPITYSPQVLQFLESRKFSVVEIARFLRVPPTKLYDTDAATYNNIEHANLEVIIDTIDAWARNLESECDAKLLSDNFGGRYSQIDIYAVFRGDMNTRSQYFTRMMQASAMSPNQIREAEGMSPYEGGDRYYIATNNFSPVDRLDEIVDSQIKAKETPEPKKEPSKVESAVIDYLGSKRAK